jgi:predicted DsbA family dithiol-disulfide isomerase
VTGVPFFVINNKYTLSGAQSEYVFKHALEQISEDEGIRSKLKTIGSSDGVCGLNGCNI